VRANNGGVERHGGREAEGKSWACRGIKAREGYFFFGKVVRDATNKKRVTRAVAAALNVALGDVHYIARTILFICSVRSTDSNI